MGNIVTDFYCFTSPVRGRPGPRFRTSFAKLSVVRLNAQALPNFFISVAYFRSAASPAGVSFSLPAFWSRLEQLARPSTAYVRPAVPPISPIPWPPSLAKAIPRKPIPSPILVSPPKPPAIMVGKPRRQKTLLRAGPNQRFLGITAVTCGFSCILLGLGFGVVAYSEFGRSGAGAGVVGVSGILGFFAFLGFCICGLWWLVLETVRWRRECELNKDYEEELAQLRSKARHERTRLGTRVGSKAKHGPTGIRGGIKSMAQCFR